MKRHATRRWMEACLLGSALATGCSQTGSRVEDHPPWIAQPVVRPRTSQPVLAQRTVEAPAAQPMPPAAPPTMLPPVASTSLSPVTPPSPPEMAPAAAPAMAATPAPSSLPAIAPMTVSTPVADERPPVRDSAVTQAGLESSKLNPVSEPPPVRKSYVDISAHPCFNHSENYRTLNGQLQFSRFTKNWRLRYASVDEVDPYGGSVTLTDDSRLGGFKDGDYVCVHGRLVSPDGRGIAPPYEVESIQAITKKD